MHHYASLILCATCAALRDGWVVGDVVLGPRRAARTRALRDASLQRTRESLEKRWKALDDEVDHLREHRRTIFNDEVRFKRLKREKLQVKDMLAALARRAPPPSIVLGAGACGTVYSALHEKTKAPAACKIARTDEGRTALKAEYDFLKRARRTCGLTVVEPLALLDNIPAPEDGGEGSALLMARLGPSIDDLFWATTCGAGFSGQTVLHIARSMLSALAGLCEADLVHGDCKPSNFLVSDKDEIILTDFGTCRERGAPSSDASVVGTPRFASSSALRGEAPSPSDDLEACAYALAYLLTGRLPFAADYDDRTTLKASSDSSLADAKDAVAPDLLCASSRKGEAPFDAAASVCAAFLREARLARREGRDPEYDALVPSFSDVEPDWRAAGVSWDDSGAIHLADYDSCTT
mmetsp:Transcript_25122/g.65326  ORF Transcript_25122/g.65326 Transcript_25122/m.65326 type:complete len:409 (-) Transcript_25122:20-1246(-)